jgi:hypothetical protein
MMLTESPSNAKEKEEKKKNAIGNLRTVSGRLEGAITGGYGGECSE